MANARNKAPRKNRKPDTGVVVRGVRFTAAQHTNCGKLSAIRALNDHCLALKNTMSAHVQRNLPRVLADAYEVGGDYRLFESDKLNAWERQSLFQSVLNTYQRRLDEVQGRYRFVVQAGWSVQRYQRKVSKSGIVIGMPGWAKPGTFELRTKRTPLVQAADLLLRLNLSTLDLSKCSEKAQAILMPYVARPEIWARLLTLVGVRQQRLLRKVKVHAFKTGTHRISLNESRCRVIKDETNGKFQWFFEMRTGVKDTTEFIRLPLAVNERYAEGLVAQGAKEFNLSVRRNKVVLGCVREADEPVFKAPGLLLGVDANTKHNLFSVSDANGAHTAAYDYDRLHLDTLIAQLVKLDKKGTANLSFREKARLSKLTRANEAALKLRIHSMLNELEAQGVSDLVLEDLGQFKGSFMVKHPEFEQKYTRLLRLLRLSSLKDWLASQAEKRGIRVHLTHAAYSSQECPGCHHVDRANRQTQEAFRCVACGHTHNADFISAQNLAHRLVSDVLSKALHSFDAFGRASPRAMNRAALKSRLTAQGAGGVIELLTPATPTKRTARKRGAHEETPPTAAVAV